MAVDRLKLAEGDGMNFPSSPALNQTYNFGLRYWKWNGAAWEAVINQAQVVSVFVVAGPFVTEIEALSPYELLPMVEITYV